MRSVCSVAAITCLLLAACGDDEATGPGTTGTGGEGQGGASTTTTGSTGGEGGMSPQGLPIGSSCATNEDCAGGVCLTEELFGWAQGYCTALCDPTLLPCEEGVCLSAGQSSICIKECLSTRDCPGVANSCETIDGDPPSTVCLGGCTESAQCLSTMNCVIEEGESIGACIPPEVCGTVGDEDGDLLSDCQDPDCATDATCAAAIDDACMDTGTLVPGTPIDASTADGTDTFASVCDGFFGPFLLGAGHEQVYTYTATTAGVLQLSATANEGDLGIYVRTACADGTTQLTCADNVFDVGETEQATVEVEAGDELTIFVDAYDGGTEGDFTLTAEFFDPVVICQSPTLILVGTTVGDTSTGTNAFSAPVSPDCEFGAGLSSELIYEYIPLLTGTLTVTLVSDTDQGIYARTECADAGTEVACADAVFDGTAQTETFDLPVTIGVPVTIFVDAYAVPGPFSLTLTQN